METLFELPEPSKKDGTQATCRTCAHRQRWEYGLSVFQYCGVRKSGRTSNGLLKIKCKDKACDLYKEFDTNQYLKEKQELASKNWNDVDPDKFIEDLRGTGEFLKSTGE